MCPPYFCFQAEIFQILFQPRESLMKTILYDNSFHADKHESGRHPSADRDHPQAQKWYQHKRHKEALEEHYQYF